MRRSSSLAAALAGAVVALAAPAAGAASGGPVRIAGVDVTGYPHVNVSLVTHVPSTTAPRLTENGVPVTGFNAVNLGAAKSVVLAIDNSRSMAGASLANATAAAQAFVDAKLPADRIAVVTIGRTAVQLTGFSSSTADADSVIRGISVDSQPGTALYDGIVQSAAALATSPTPGRVLILLTDGRDVSSTATLDQATAAARKAGVSIYSIGIKSRDFDPSALQEIARSANGSFRAASSSALRQVYTAIADELSRTWRLGYDTTSRPGDRIDLRATVPGTGSAQRSFAIPVTFGAVTTAPPSGLLPASAYSTMGALGLALIVGVLVALSIAVLLGARRGSWVKQRLAPHVGETQLRKLRREERVSFLAALFKMTESALGQRAQWRSIERLLVRADLPLRPTEFVWASLGSGLGLGLLAAVTAASAPLILVAMVVGMGIPFAVAKVRVRRRSKAFENQLPDLLATIAASLKAGHSFKHGLQAVVDESQPPASIELRRALTETGLGRPLDDALSDMADRVDSANFSFAITAVTIQRQVGGSLATLFDMVAETVRQRQQFARKIRSLTAMGRMSAYTLIGLPFFITGMITVVNAGYMSPLYHSHTGHILLIVGALMMIFGSLILQKIVSFRG